ncbi:asparaginase domain-containing protein [Guyparkeria sp.]|uniref:asparaginase domain-containing protein n=1 Tax=Guyparkeria sp. TaxID=2035736 RepID=UPI00356A7098
MSDSSDLPVLLVDAGGTFNKRYDPIRGDLQVVPGHAAVDMIVASARENLDLVCVQPVCKDSLEMTDADREAIVAAIDAADPRWRAAPVIVIHGTDTMEQTAEVIAGRLADRLVVLTGAMRPFEIDAVEPALNLGLALGFVQGASRPGIFLAMSGLVRPLGELAKDREAGVFRPVRARGATPTAR